MSSLFTWRNENDRLLSPLVHSLKGGWAPAVVERLAEAFALERLQEKPLQIDALVPAPGGRYDHAKAWAEALSRVTGAPIMDVLQKSPGRVRHQRFLSAEERTELRFHLKSPQLEYRGPLVFVDDVITTGSTAMAAYMALGDPREFEVWTMVSRPRLARHGAV